MHPPPLTFPQAARLILRSVCMDARALSSELPRYLRKVTREGRILGVPFGEKRGECAGYRRVVEARAARAVAI